MLRTRWTLALACALPGCADDAAGPIAFEALCGVRGPVRVLELPPDQIAFARVLDDRLYYARLTLDADGDWRDGVPTLESIGPCGEAPRHIADGVLAAMTLDRWPGVLFGCIDGTGLVSLDPEGQQPPHLVIPAATPRCDLNWTDHGVLEFVADDAGDGGGVVVLRSIPADPRRDTAETEVLLDLTAPTRVAFTAGSVHYLDPGRTVMRLDLADRELTAIQDNVHSYALSPDERYLLWQDATPTGGTAEKPTGVVNLRIADTATSVALGGALGRLEDFSLKWADQGLMIQRIQDANRVYSLPDLDLFDIPGAWITDLLPDRRLLVQRFDGGPWLSVVDLDTRAATTLFRRSAQIVEIAADSVIIVDLPPCCSVDATPVDEGRVWRVPLDGSEPRLLAESAAMFTPVRLDATRMLVGQDLTEDRRMTLVLVDLETRAARPIDHLVAGWTAAPGGTDLTYSVRDGARSGLWRVRLPVTP